MSKRPFADTRSKEIPAPGGSVTQPDVRATGWSKRVAQMRVSLGSIGILLMAQGAFGHDYRPRADVSGYAIPSIDHGAMAVISTYRRPIMALADQAGPSDEKLAALLLHNRLQSANCLWLWLPGSVNDEESPLNECAHADLAGLKGIVDRLRSLPQTRAAADLLVSEIDRDMVYQGTSFSRCEYSTETFNTASQVRPDWSDVIAYLLTRHQLTVGGTLAFVILTYAALRQATHRLQKQPKQRSHAT